ncbi:MAG: PepSY-associated TM helix domain-containing protein [Polyangiales bacterium]
MRTDIVFSVGSRGRSWRRRLWDLHAALGLALGVLFAVIALTGSAAVFRRELDWLTTPALRVAPGGARVGADAVLRAARGVMPEGAPFELRPPEGARFAYVVLWRVDAQTTEVFVDPTTARVTGVRPWGDGLGSFANGLRQLHVRLLLGLWGRALVGALGLALVAVALAGLALGRRRRGAASNLRAARANRHAQIGRWTVAFHLLLGGSGAVLGLEVLPHALARLGRPAPPARAAPAARPAVTPARLDRVIDSARKRFPGHTLRGVRFDRDPRIATVMLDVPSPWVRRGATEVIADLARGVTVAAYDATRGPLAARAYDTLDPLHFGYFGEAWGTVPGLLIRALWSLLGLSPAWLALSGFRMMQARTERRPEVSAPALSVRAA